MKLRDAIVSGTLGAAILVPAFAAVTASAQQGGSANATAQNLPAGEGRDLLQKDCTGCHQLNVITSAHKTESQWTDTVVEMRTRGASGSDEDMEKIVKYLAANFGPQSSAPAAATTPTAATAPTAITGGTPPLPPLPPKKPLATPEQVVTEHFAALNACDWKRMMQQYDDRIAFLSKDGAIVEGREAIGRMFQKALQPPPVGQCGMKLIPERTIVVGDTVNVIWRAEAPFFAEPYRGSEAFETKNGLLVVQVTTWDPSAIKMKQ